VSYSRVFGSKCNILVKKGRNSKFAPKAVEGFLLGYGSNTKAYRVFNKSSGLVEVSSDVVFDETNGSPREQVVDLDDVNEEDVPTAVIRTMAIGDVRPQEQKEQDQPSSSTMVHLGVETSRAELGSARLAAARSRNELGSARLAHPASSEKRLGSARSRLASRLAEPTRPTINLNMFSKL
jgi:hypothetical protein